MCCWRPCAIVPVYNHEHAIAAVVSRLLAVNLPVILVNDGSGETCRRELKRLADDFEQVDLMEFDTNRGKGAAVKAGFRQALASGYSHGLQVDADGQHCIEDAPVFLQTGRDNPEAVVNGYPVYGDDVPRHRLYGRYLTYVWVTINTLSFSIRDSMCGYRLYPLAETVALLDDERVGDRMDFDTEILVRWLWRGGNIINLPTRVAYPLDGVSHFALWRDNLLISKMHARLFFGMLWRAPVLLWKRLLWKRLSKIKLLWKKTPGSDR